MSTNEKNKLIFIKNESLIDSEKIININYNLIIMKRNLENFKLKLINLKNNLDKNKNNFDKFAFSGENFFNYIVSELQTFKSFKNNPNSLIDEKNVFFIWLKEKIDIFYENLKKIKEIKTILENKQILNLQIQKDLKIYNGLPKDLSQIREMIKNKKIELEYL